MASLARPFTRARGRLAAPALLRETERQLNETVGQWLGTRLTFDKSSLTVIAWAAADVGEQVQVSGTWRFTLANEPLSLTVVLSHDVSDAFEGAGFSPSFLAAWWKRVAVIANARFAEGFDFRKDPGFAPHLEPWESLRFDSFTDSSFRVYVYDVIDQVEVKALTVDYSVVPSPTPNTILRAHVAGRYVSTHQLIAYAALKLVASEEEALEVLDWDFPVHESMLPERFVQVNYTAGLETHEAVSRALGRFDGPVLTATAEGVELAQAIPAHA